MEKRYILLTVNNSKYEGFVKHSFKLFNSYWELQNHLLKFSNEPVFYVFEETSIRKDKSFIITNKRRYYD